MAPAISYASLYLTDFGYLLGQIFVFEKEKAEGNM